MSEQIRSAVHIVLKGCFGLSTVEAAILTTLFQADHPLSVEAVADSAVCSAGAVSVHMIKVRDALARGGVVHITRQGYVLNQAGKEECRDAVTQFAATLRAVG